MKKTTEKKNLKKEKIKKFANDFSELKKINSKN